MCYNTRMESNNKGIYIFWGLILVVVVAVVLFFVIPRTDYALAYKSYASVTSNTNQEISEEKTYLSFVEDAKGKFGAVSGVSGIANLTMLTTIQSTFALAEDYSRTSLMFVEKTDKYLSAAKTLNKAGKGLNKDINEFQEYCTTILQNALNQPSLPTSEINHVINGLNQRYTELLKSYADYYEKVAVVIDNHSIKNIENNPTVINAHKNIIINIKTELNKQNMSQTQISSIYNTAMGVYSSVYYITHF